MSLPSANTTAGKKAARAKQDDRDAVDSPEITDFSGFRPARESHPRIVAAYEAGKLRLAKRHRGPNKAPTKVKTTILFSPLVMRALKEDGAGWQTRLDHVLAHLIQHGQFKKLESKAEKEFAEKKLVLA